VRQVTNLDQPHAWSQLQRPSLEFRHAFDFCAVEVHRLAGPVAVFASSAFCARELLRRLGDCSATLFPIGKWAPSAPSAQPLFGPEVTWQDLASGGSASGLVDFSVALWAEPDREDSERVLKHLGRMLRPGGHLYVVASGRLARFLPEWRRDQDRPGERRAGLLPTLRLLPAAGFTAEAVFGFHGPMSILWSYASRIVERLGRGDCADRCHFKMRAEYVVRGWQAAWTPVSVAVTRRH
jgi:hypothetical protein